MLCYVAWGYENFYGQYGKDFYDYHEFMKDKGIEEINMWEGELFDHPYYEDEKFK